jgi:nitroimidazol reductase NimA-like FMN-containing flavoprotein (pyridoxamine 5'-phosphate oxidase superfamily)
MVKNVITGYPQMPPLTPEELEALLSQSLVARLGTMNDDGTIHLAPIYFKYDNGDIILGTQVASRRVRNIMRNPKVTLLVDVATPPYKAAMIYGTASLHYESVAPQRTAIFAKNASPEQARAAAEGLCKKWDSVIIRIKPERIVSFDYAKASLL